MGRLTSLTDQSGSSAFVYDALGHIASDTRVIAGNSYGTAYTYDAAGNILTETYPSGRIVTYTRDALGRILGITTKQNSGASAVTVASGVGYEPFGPLSGFTFGNSLVAAFTYDQDYQLTDIDAAKPSFAVQDLTNAYDADGNITSITDHIASSRTQTLTYDNLNRVALASHASLLLNEAAPNATAETPLHPRSSAPACWPIDCAATDRALSATLRRSRRR